MLWAADVPTDAGGADASFLVGLVNYGVLGTIFLLGILGYVYFKPSITDLKNQNESLRKDFNAQIESIRKDYTDQIAALRKDHTEQVSGMRVERDKAMDQRNAMAETFQKEWMPALVKSLATVEALLPLMQRIVDRSGGDQR